jgi:hypothetical protein
MSLSVLENLALLVILAILVDQSVPLCLQNHEHRSVLSALLDLEDLHLVQLVPFVRSVLLVHHLDPLDLKILLDLWVLLPLQHHPFHL